MDGFMNLAKQGYSAYQKSQETPKTPDSQTQHGSSNDQAQRPSYGQGQQSQGSYGQSDNDYDSYKNSGHNSDDRQGQGQYGQSNQQSGTGSYDRPSGQGYGQQGQGQQDQSRQDDYGRPSGQGYGQQGQGQQGQNRQDDYERPSEQGYGQQGGQYGQSDPNKTGGQDYNAPSYGRDSAPSSDYNKTGGQEYNAPSYGQDSYGSAPPINQQNAIDSANAHAENSGDKSLFAQALSFATSSNTKKPVDEDHVTNAHKDAYENNNAQNMDAGSIGSAAAMQAFKSYTSGSKSGSNPSTPSGGDMQTKIIAMAMAEAAKLFDKSGGAQSGNKQDAVNGAATTVMKLLVQSKFGGGGTTGGKDSGGLGQLMSLASKFAK